MQNNTICNQKQKRKRRSSCSINGFKYPSSDNISGRTSTICRSMACTLLMRKSCSPEDAATWMKYFPEKNCAYCGRPASHLDHLHALILDRRPTGYGTEPANLVPCCKDCNQPKGNLQWDDYMRSNTCNHFYDSQTETKEIAVERRISIIKKFQEEMTPQKVELDDSALAKWDEILTAFEINLQAAQNELLKMKKQLYPDEA